MYCKKCIPTIVATSLIINAIGLLPHFVKPGLSQEQIQTQQQTSEQEKNKALVTEFFNEVFNQIRELYATP